MTQTPPSIRIETREQLLYTLTEAAEIEHNLMCCYLYAAFSMKQDEAEGLSADDLEVVGRWRRAIIHVAVEEMSHLALVSNLMISIGGAPHFGRPNFPITPGYHPAGIQVHLAPFDRETLQHFVFLERPEGCDERDGVGFEAPQRYRRVLGEQNRLMPSGQDYETVGELYHAIAEGLKHLAERDGEGALFVGGPSRQVGPDLVNLRGLQKISGLDDALAAIETIVVQGEGARNIEEAGHYQQFVSIRKEYEAILSERPDFTPGRSVAHNPVMRKPVTPGTRVWVNRPDAASVMDYANALYGQMLRLLSQAFGRDGAADEKEALLDAAINLMFAITPAAEQLTVMQANDEDEHTGGMSFATLRPLTALPVGTGEWAVLGQRFSELERVGRTLAHIGPRLTQSVEAIESIASTFHQRAAQFSHATDNVTAPTPTSPTLADAEVVDGKDVILSFDSTRCIHARHCVTGAPKTFLANVEGPWLHPDETPVEQLATIAAMCPSGAITLRRKDGVADEVAPAVNLCQIRENGPYAMRAELEIDGEPAGYRATLCRCGNSKNKPFCDGSHGPTGFEASGEPATVSSDPIAPRAGTLEVRSTRNGPLAVSGPLEICAGTGRVVKRVNSARLCRCGGSATKPFCDGTHARIGFQSD